MRRGREAQLAAVDGQTLTCRADLTSQTSLRDSQRFQGRIFPPPAKCYPRYCLPNRSRQTDLYGATTSPSDHKGPFSSSRSREPEFGARAQALQLRSKERETETTRNHFPSLYLYFFPTLLRAACKLCVAAEPSRRHAWTAKHNTALI